MSWADRLAWTTIAGLALGLAGPFGSYAHADTLDRLAYWVGLSWTGTLVLGLTIDPVLRLARRNRWPRNFAAAAAILAGSVPVALAAAVVGRRVWPLETAGVEPLHWYAQTVFVASPLVVGILWLERRRGEVPPKADAPGSALGDGSPPPVASPSGELLRRVRAQALCLQMEDHYVRVHTSAGSQLVLLPMHRAIDALGETEGLQVHRSWWVARDAIRDVVIEGRAVALVLTDGMRVPVARNRVAELRAKGWLNPHDPAQSPGSGQGPPFTTRSAPISGHSEGPL